MTDVKQVIVWRNDLNVPKGKFAAQIAHASMAFLTHALQESYEYHSWDGTQGFEDVAFTRAEMEWISGTFTKVVVFVRSEEELIALHENALNEKLTSHLITDSGFTVFNKPTRTCLAIGPDYSEKIDVVTGHLKLL